MDADPPIGLSIAMNGECLVGRGADKPAKAAAACRGTRIAYSPIVKRGVLFDNIASGVVAANSSLDHARRFSGCEINCLLDSVNLD